MLKKVLSTIIIGTSLFLGENTMAENSLNAKQQSIAEAAAYAARVSISFLRGLSLLRWRLMNLTARAAISIKICLLNVRPDVRGQLMKLPMSLN